MKKQQLLLLTLVVFSLNCAMAQQLPNTSYFMYDHSRTNPGSLGSMDMVCATALMQLPLSTNLGLYENYLFSVEAPFKLGNTKHGAGISFITDNIGFYKDIDLRIGYAFRFNVADGTLGIGINGNLREKSLEGAEWIGPQGSDVINDPNIPDANQKNINSFGLSAGLFYRSEDIYLGASVANIYATETEYTGNVTEIIRPHYYVTAGYNFQLSNSAYELEPAINIYSDAVSTTFDINGILRYNKKVWGGVSYRAGSALVFMFGFVMLDGMKIGVAYDYNTSALSKYSNGKLEFLLNYCFKLGVEKSPQRYRSIRYL